MREQQKRPGQLEQAKWLRNHSGYYRPDGYVLSEENQRLFEDMAKYTENMHTYPAEALKTYRRIQEKFNNNPYAYISGLGQETEQIFADRLDAYFLPLGNGQSIPAAMLAAEVSADDMKARYMDFLAEKQAVYSRERLIPLEKEVEGVNRELNQLTTLWLSGRRVKKKTSIVAWICLLVMWILYFVELIPGMRAELSVDYGYATGMMTGGGIVCVISLIILRKGWLNLRKLRDALQMQNKMKTVVMFVERFHRQICNPYNISFLVDWEKLILPQSGIPWEDYFEAKTFVEKIKAKDRKKLLLINGWIVCAYLWIIVIELCLSFD